jgi:drug/metabolite transporter (DMT)-like permease
MTGILLKVASVSVFVTMSTLIKSGAEAMPAGQIVFFRSAFAMVPILVFLALRGQLDTAWRTANPLSHFRRGLVGVTAMGFGFYGIMRLPLPDAIAIGYAMPLLTVVFAACFWGEKVRIFRWSAVVVGLGGVLIITWPRLSLFGDGFGSSEALGVMAVLASAALGATAMILVRKLVLTEKTPTIVLYFSLTATVLSLVTLPFGWIVPDWPTLVMMALAGLLRRSRPDPADPELPPRRCLHDRAVRIHLDHARHPDRLFSVWRCSDLDHAHRNGDRGRRRAVRDHARACARS